MINQCTFNRKRLSIFWDYRYNLTRRFSVLRYSQQNQYPADSFKCQYGTIPVCGRENDTNYSQEDHLREL